jgi:hypothetical protein
MGFVGGLKKLYLAEVQFANNGPQRQLLNGLPVHLLLVDVPVIIGEAMEKLDAAETRYNVVSCKFNTS